MNGSIFLILNAILSVVFILITAYANKYLRANVKEVNSLLIPMLLLCVESILLTVILFFKNIWIESFISQLTRIVFCLDGIFFVAFTFGLISMAANTKKLIITIIKLALIVFVFYFVYSKFEKVFVAQDSYNVFIGSAKLFQGPAGEYFPLTWVTFYDLFFRGVLPITGLIFLLLLQEKNGTTLQRFQGLLIGFSFILMWGTSYFFKNYMTKANVSFSCLFIFPYLFMMLTIVIALQKTTVPSGKSIMATILQTLVTYLIPAGILGFLVMYMQPAVTNPYALFGLFAAFAIAGIIFSLKIHQVLSGSKRIYSADYAVALERDLGAMNYNGEMDEITNRMNSIFRNNVEASSMNVYITNNKGMLETAYSSNNFQKTIPVSNPIFDELLNVEKSVVLQSEIGHVHIISNIDSELEKFFEETKSDALFILNEGRNILGLITLGRKISGDHYKEYDLNVFNKLYSYFFVFGYYMRNISNKEIISVVNREIRMSSQIITSIQENIDHIKNPKVDTGYMMVPAKNLGGEFIDMIRLTDTRHLVLLGDLSGKGIAASMNMVILKSIIRTYLAETHDFKELVVKINSFIRTSFRKGTIFAGLFALIDFETDTMYYINCGVPALMLYTQVYNNVIEIQGSGHVLGFVKDIGPYISVKSTKFNPGDIILACTDGLVQSHSLRGEQFGKERIQQCILDNSTYPAQRMAQFTFDTLTKFMSKEMEDDVSILVLKYRSANEVTETEEAEVPVSEETPVIDESAIAQAMAEAEAEVAAQTGENPEVVESEESKVEEAPVEEEKFDMNIPESVDFSEIAEDDMFVNPVSSSDENISE